MHASKMVIPQGDNKKSSMFWMFLHLSSMIDIDSDVPETVAEDLRAIKDVLRVRVLN